MISLCHCCLHLAVPPADHLSLYGSLFLKATKSKEEKKDSKEEQNELTTIVTENEEQETDI
jgi:hypothetical protein